MSPLRPGAPRFPPGTILGARYRVERVLAAGTKGMMLEATDLERGNAVAIKVLRPARRTPQLAARIAREARIAGRLSSAHLAPACAFGHTDGGDPFLVTELLSGRDLAAELAERGPLPIAEAVDIVVEACAGVAEAHAAGLLHRDLKPSNLFMASPILANARERSTPILANARERSTPILANARERSTPILANARERSTPILANARERSPTPTPTVKVLDFGLTRAPNEKGQVDLTVTESDFGTPQYLSPEQIRSADRVDARTDQHALGAVLYELCTGKPPFQAPDVTQLAVAIAVDPPPRARDARPEVPAALDDAIRRALGKRPDDRFPDLRAFAEAIAPFGGERSRDALQAMRVAERSRQAPVPHDHDPAATTSDPDHPRARRSPVLALVSAIALLGAFGAYRLATRPAYLGDARERPSTASMRAAAATAPEAAGTASASATPAVDAGASPLPKSSVLPR